MTHNKQTKKNKQKMKTPTENQIEKELFELIEDGGEDQEFRRILKKAKLSGYKLAKEEFKKKIKDEIKFLEDFKKLLREEDDIWITEKIINYRLSKLKGDKLK